MKYSNIKRDIARTNQVKVAGSSIVYPNTAGFPNTNNDGQRAFASDIDKLYIWLQSAASGAGGWYNIPRTTDPI